MVIPFKPKPGKGDPDAVNFARSKSYAPFWFNQYPLTIISLELVAATPFR
jgi:hypothetical protein